MTATIRNCNPNGTDYIWYISDSMKDDMSNELVKKIDDYDTIYNHYKNDYIAKTTISIAKNEDKTFILGTDFKEDDIIQFVNLNEDNASVMITYTDDAVSMFKLSPGSTEKLLITNQKIIQVQGCSEVLLITNAIDVSKYNYLVNKYKKYNDNLLNIQMPIKGYHSLINAYYNAIDLALYLQTSMMPTVSMSDTSALKQSELLIKDRLSPVSVSNIDNISLATANNAVLSMANSIIDSRYRVKISSSSMTNVNNKCIWIGNFTVTNYSDEEDTATSNIVSIDINDNYSNFIKQKINQYLKKDNTDDLSITGLFSKIYESFVEELKLYSLDCLESFHSSCQGCIDILIEQGIGNRETWDGQTPNLYDNLYMPYINKLEAIELEMKVRSEEIAMIKGVYNIDGELTTYGLQNYIENEISLIHTSLDFQNYLGYDLWLEFCTFRREDKYSNPNYISDGLNNDELFKQANEFIQSAQNEIYKSVELQHSISTTLKNILTIEKFKPLVNQFEIGNWLRVIVDDKLYKLRLIKYTIDYNDLKNIFVEFSDVVNVNSTISSIQDVLNQANSMATSYSTIQKQAQHGEKSNSILNEWVNYGLDATNTKIVGDADHQNQVWDKHGMLFRKYDTISDEYSPIQLKIINSTIAITDDNWKSTKTAIGNFMYYDYQTKQLKSAYGINGEVIVGKLLIGQGLGIYNSSGSVTFDENGLQVTNNINTVSINPNNASVFNIQNKTGSVLSFDEDGNLIIVGNITASSLTLSDDVKIDNNNIDGLSNVATTGKYGDLIGTPDLSKYAKSEVLDMYIKKDGVIGSNPSEDSTGFTVSKDGLLQASNAIIYGTLYSSKGVIGGWTIGNNSLYNGTSGITSTDVGTYIGIDGIRQYKDENAYVDIQNGIIKAFGGDFSGGNIIGSTITGGSISIGDNFNVDTSGNVVGSSFTISANGVFVPSQYINLRDNGLVLHTHYIDPYGGITYDVGNICLSTTYCNTGIYMSDIFVDTEDVTNSDNNWKIAIRASGSIDASLSISTPRLTANNIYSDWSNITKVESNEIYSNYLKVNGNVDLCKNGGTVIVYPQTTSAGSTEGGEIMLCNAGITNWNSISDSVNIDNLNGDLRVYFYANNSYHAMILGKDGVLNVEGLVLNGTAIKSNTLTTAGLSCYFTYNDEEPARHFRPPNSGLVRLGTPSYRWSEVWCTQSSLNSTSDERMKDIDGEVQYAEELIRTIHPIQYKFVDGESGRTHYGFGSQTFKDDLINIGLDPNKIAAFLCDVTEEAKANGVTLDTATEDEKVYGLRYNELIAPIVCVIQKLLNRVDELEKLLK